MPALRALLVALLIVASALEAQAQDTTAPFVNSFTVSPSTVGVGSAFTIQATVSDTGGSGLRRVELWRATDNAGAPGAFSQITFVGVGGNGPASVQFTNAPPVAGVYWYQVRVFDGGNNQGTGGPIAATVSDAPTAFAKTSPLNGAANRPTAVVLQWDASTNVTRYEYCIDQVANAQCDTGWLSAGRNTEADVTLNPGTTYQWQVRAVGGSGTTDANGGAWWTFSTAACTLVIDPPSATLGAEAGGGTISVTTQAGCAWTATSNSGFLTVTGGGTGSGSVTFSVTENTGTSERVGTATIGERTFTVTQAGSVACTFSITPNSTSVVGTGAKGTIIVDTQPGCTWTATSDDAFLTFTNATGRSGPGTLAFTVAGNPARASRVGTATVAGQHFAVNQADGLRLRLAPDVNADGDLDVIWQNRAGGGYLAAWLMDGLNLTDSALFSPSQVSDPNWRIAAAGDVDGDGRLDLIWQEETQGWIGVWKMNGLTLVSSLALSVERVPTDWKIVAAQDFDNDGKADILWHDRRLGYVAIWFMNGATVRSSELISPHVGDTKWQVEAAADFNADGKPDLVWRHQEQGWLAVWLMDGLTLLESRSVEPARVTDTNWRIAAVGDVNRDNMPDLIWHDVVNGWIAVWVMNGTNLASSLSFNPERVPDTNWRVVGPK